MNKQQFKPSKVVNGTWGEIWFDGEYMAECTSFKAEVNIKTTEIAQCQTLVSGAKMTGLEQKGELKMHKTNSKMIKKYAAEVRAGRLPEVDIISKVDDPDTDGYERVACYGCTIDKIPLADWEAGKVGEESYSFDFRDYKVLDTMD